MAIIISTHSPRVGRTSTSSTCPTCLTYFNSLAPCGANRRARPYLQPTRAFQLTRPVWGEPRLANFSRRRKRISTHSPRVGRTLSNVLTLSTAKYFNSLAPCGANLTAWAPFRPRSSISTHSPRVGRTSDIALDGAQRSHFNSLAPCGANLDMETVVGTYTDFNSLAPCGANPIWCNYVYILDDFNSLAPCGANLMRYFSHSDAFPFQLTRPVWGEPRPRQCRPWSA